MCRQFEMLLLKAGTVFATGDFMGQAQVDCLITASETSPLAILPLSEPFLKRCCPSKLRPQCPEEFVTIAAFLFAAALSLRRQRQMLMLGSYCHAAANLL